MNGNQISQEEKYFLACITPKNSEMDFPQKKIEVDGHDPELEYVIPQEKKAEVLKKLWPFDGKPPAMEDTLQCIHEGKTFKVKDFKVISVRFVHEQLGYRFFPMLASPFYRHSGGTILDWASTKEEQTIICDNAANGVVVTVMKKDIKPVEA